ncbi:MAG: TetR/AcrR family transcriptional regulator [Chloroflexota bacterium]
MAISDEQILQAVADVIAERGYAGATTKQIAAKAGINEVTLFRRFGNKKNLMRSMVQHEAVRLGGMNLSYSGDLEADLTSIVHVYQQLMLRRGEVLLMLLSELRKQPDLVEVVETPQAQARRIGMILARYQQEGKLVQEPPLVALSSLIGPIFMSAMLGSLEATLMQNLVKPQQLVKQFLHGRATKG